jgi:hypothetical protein
MGYDQAVVSHASALLDPLRCTGHWLQASLPRCHPSDELAIRILEQRHSYRELLGRTVATVRTTLNCGSTANTYALSAEKCWASPVASAADRDNTKRQWFLRRSSNAALQPFDAIGAAELLPLAETFSYGRGGFRIWEGLLSNWRDRNCSRSGAVHVEVWN